MAKLELKLSLSLKPLFQNEFFFFYFEIQVLLTSMKKSNPFRNQVIHEIRIFCNVCSPSLFSSKFLYSYHTIMQGSPTPRPRTSTSPWPVRSLAAQQEVSGGQVSEASSVFTATPHHWHYCLSSPSCQISSGIRFSQECKPYCELRMQGIQIAHFL